MLRKTHLFLLNALLLLSATLLHAEEAWLAYGDLRGYLEPCGCDPKTDLGGIRRVAQVVALERMNHKDLFVFDLGNLFVPSDAHVSKNEQKNKFLLNGIMAIQPSAVLFNQQEYAVYKKSKNLRDLLRKSQLPYVLSNASDEIRKAKFVKPFLVLGNNLILGFSEHQEWSSQLDSSLDQKLIKDWQALIKTYKNYKTFFLFSGSKRTLQKILANFDFDQIILSNMNPPEHQPGKEEKENETLLKFVVGAKDLYSVPLSGQGVLRGGILRQQVAQPLNQILHPQFLKNFPESKTPKDLAPIVPGLKEQTLYTWLDPSFNEGAPLEEIVKNYYAAQQNEFEQRKLLRKNQLEHSPYVGAEACKACHQPAFQVWQKSKHYHAMFSLQEKDKHEVLECVLCHSLAADKAGGYVSLTDTPQFAHVQCEVCHGPRKAHILKPEKPMKKKALQEYKPLCETCHNRTHSPDFSFEIYWKRIKH